MTGAVRKTSTERVRRHRANAGKVRVTLLLDQDEADLLAARGVFKEWASPAENAEAVAALVHMNLRKLLKP
jgi:hypothetical protein